MYDVTWYYEEPIFYFDNGMRMNFKEGMEYIHSMRDRGYKIEANPNIRT